MTKYEVGVYLTSFNVVNIEAGTEREAKDIALKQWGAGEFELFTDKRAEAIIEDELDA